ncbi:unnamed protein product [Nippostrongylus brasiliensis]|uniref:Multisubstrate adaptor protein SOC-1 (inferred by orthology to a C. elegans protein) n=1 Tax=Nippostrongylus brasiliensis TaxID=27835 RepID=A0A0N4YQB2_NIPBR|nr:unnamed protein product [Nippostrongylus brasiliensis]
MAESVKSSIASRQSSDLNVAGSDPPASTEQLQPIMSDMSAEYNELEELKMTDSVYMEGWLIRSRDRGMHFPPFKSKWVRRYFVLRVCDKRLGAYVLDEFRKEDKRRLRKSLDLVRCVQIK